MPEETSLQRVRSRVEEEQNALERKTDQLRREVSDLESKQRQLASDLAAQERQLEQAQRDKSRLDASVKVNFQLKARQKTRNSKLLRPKSGNGSEMSEPQSSKTTWLKERCRE